MEKNFQVFKDYFGAIIDDCEGSIVYGFENISKPRTPSFVDIPVEGACYGYVGEGSVVVHDGDILRTVKQGDYFTTRSNCTITFLSSKYRVVVWQKVGFDGMNSIGRVEDSGRLKYIDNCMDSMLSHPIKFGDPCLNALYMPNGVNQTMHTHPSTRAGYIITGGAKCITPEAVQPLEDGMIFYLPTDKEHKFVTDHNTSAIMKLVAYHPDSDFGATDEVHPMINRTMVEGVSASNIESIRTK